MTDEQQRRQELACAFQWCARLNLHEGVANHFSVAVGEAGRYFLMNPGGRHFSRIAADDLLLLDSQATTAHAEVDATAWCLHGYLHRHLPQARCLLHTHMPYATACASLDNWQLLPIDQNACRFYNRIAYDDTFGGMLLAEEEAARQCTLLGAHKVLVMRSHGVLIAAATVAEAFDLMYYFEHTCRNQWLALASGKPLRILPAAIAEKTAQQWQDYPHHHHFEQLQAILADEQTSI